MNKLLITVITILTLITSVFILRSEAQWQKISITDGANINLMTKDSSGYLFAVTNNQLIYRSSNNGSTWENFTNGLSTTIQSIISTPTSVMIATYNGVYRTTNHGVNWYLSNSGLTYNIVKSFHLKDNYVFLGCSGKVFRSSNDGLNWSTSNINLGMSIEAIGSVGNYLFAEAGIGSRGKMCFSTNYGDSWDSVIVGDTGFRFSISTIASCGNTIYAAGGGTYRVYKSTNFGQNWTSVPGLPSSSNAQANSVTTLGNIVTVTYLFSYLNYLIYISTNSGISFYPTAAGLITSGMKSCLITNNGLFANCGSGIFKSTNFGVNWFGSNSGFSDLNFPCVIATDSVVIAGTDAHGIYMSRNYGSTWSMISEFGNTASSYSFKYDSEKIYLLKSGGIACSTNKGNTWNTCTLPVYDATSSFCPNGNLIYLATNQGLYKTTNFGVNWVRSDNGLPAFYIFSNSIFINNSIGLVQIWNLSAEYVMYKTTNNGTNWFLVQNPGGSSNQLNYIAENLSNLFAGTQNGLYKSTNSGVNWVQINNGLPNTPTTGFFVKDNIIYASFGSMDLYKSINNGANWQPYNEGISSGVLKSMSGSDTYLYSSGDGAFYIRNIQTGINIYSNNIPDKFSLSQNYPNPFNPTTNIRYQIANNKYVILKIYDILGKEIETLINEKQSPGTYEVNWNAAGYPSGIYFYRLQAGDFSETKKMVLIK